jgi:hypothetical protein
LYIDRSNDQSAAALNATDMQLERHLGFFLEKKTNKNKTQNI